ncbi:MAG TPA: PsbP-related protein [Methanobacteriaceae archaeon]|nr:PsbP-related protein [Methanobacteriaceae archaeon]
MKKYLLLLFIILAVLMASGCVTDNNNATNSYAQNNVTFNYPGTWAVANTTSPNAVAAVADPKSVISDTSSPTTLVVIQKAPLPKGSDLRKAYDDNYASFFNNTGYQKVSEANITNNNLNASENVYTSNSGGIEKQFRAVWLQKNGYIYVILCSAKKDVFDSQQSKFDLIISSFRAQ